MILDLFPLAADYPLLAPFVFLLVGHALGDYALQTEFMVEAKSPRFGSIWPWVLGSHCLIHGFLVAIILNNPVLGLLELAAHFVIDLAKSNGLFGRGDFSFHVDQILHVACKALWVAMFVGAVPMPGL